MRNGLLNHNGFDARFDRLLDNFFADGFLTDRRPVRATEAFMPKLDVLSTKEAIQVKAELPGIDEKDVDVSLDKQHLVIRGEKRSELKEETEAEVYAERSFGQFERRVVLPKAIDRDNVTAEFKNGILTVTVPRSKEALEEVKKISINGISSGDKH